MIIIFMLSWRDDDTSTRHRARNLEEIGHGPERLDRAGGRQTAEVEGRRNLAGVGRPFRRSSSAGLQVNTAAG